ncbi:MAG: hypothetical protein KJ956_02830 [Actinobacteria bacterium]|nr:hypothetical protein [Actinomycetota bacterium]
MRRLVISSLASLLVIGCGGTGGDAGAATTTTGVSTTTGASTTTSTAVLGDDSDPFTDPLSVEVDPFEVALGERLDDSGMLPTQAALDLFSAAYGQIPEGHSDRFPDLDPHAGTLAIAALGAHYDELTAEQQNAFLDAVEGPDRDLGSQGDVLASAPTPDARFVDAMQPAHEFEALVTRQRDAIAAEVGRPLAIELRVVVMSGPAPPRVAADAQAQRGGRAVWTGQPDSCVMRFWPSAIGRLDDTYVAHEVFHCFQFAMAPDLGAFNSSPIWVIEGQAYWAEDRIAGVDRETPGDFHTWLCRPGDALTNRSRSAIGFYAVVEQFGFGYFWQYFDDMFGLSDTQAIEAIGADKHDVARALATSRMNDDDTYEAPYWHLEAPGFPRSACRRRAAADLDHPFEWSANLGSFAAGPPFVVDIEGDVVKVQASGDGALEFFKGTLLEWVGEVDTTICLIEGGCTCPDGSPIGDQEASPGPVTAAVGAIRGPASITIQPLSVEDACQTVPGDLPRMVLRGNPNWDLVGGVCFVDDAGYLNLPIGYVDNWDARLQDEPWTHAHALIFVRADPGIRDTGTLYIWEGDGPFRDGDGDLVVTLSEDLLTGTFSWKQGSGSFSCPRVLTAGEFADLVAGR